VFKLQDGIVEGGEPFLLVVRGKSLGRDDGGDEECFVNIHATADWVNDFQ